MVASSRSTPCRSPLDSGNPSASSPSSSQSSGFGSASFSGSGTARKRTMPGPAGSSSNPSPSSASWVAAAAAASPTSTGSERAALPRDLPARVGRLQAAVNDAFVGRVLIDQHQRVRRLTDQVRAVDLSDVIQLAEEAAWRRPAGATCSSSTSLARSFSAPCAGDAKPSPVGRSVTSVVLDGHAARTSRGGCVNAGNGRARSGGGNQGARAIAAPTTCRTAA